MNGNASRLVSRPKHNLRVIFRDDYGEGTLNYPLFGKNAETERFNSHLKRRKRKFMDSPPQVFTKMLCTLETNGLGMPMNSWDILKLTKRGHVYFNGLYWGMHHLFERIEEEWRLKDLVKQRRLGRFSCYWE